MSAMRMKWFSLFVFAVAVAGCRPAKEAPPPPPPPAVTVATPVSYSVQSYREYNGYLDPIETVRITARVKGFLLDVRFVEGQEVRKGRLLYRIDPREFELAVRRNEANRLEALAALKKARADEDRTRKIRENNPEAISDEELAQRVAARETAEALIKQSEAAIDAAKLELGYTEIRAPIDGQISRTLVTPGNLVGQGEATLLTTIVSVDPIYVYFDIPERDLVEYQGALSAHLFSRPRIMPVEIGVATETGYPHRGFIDFRENRVDTGTGTVRLRGRIPNPKVGPGAARRLYVGLYARVRVPIGGPRPQLVIPEDALMTGQEGRFVYVVGNDNMVQKRIVTVGTHVSRELANREPKWFLSNPSKPDQSAPVFSAVAIEKGLQSDDRVIVNGITKARPSTPVAPEDWTLQAPR